MNAKKNKFKLIRFIFYFLGFPTLCLATIYLLGPTFSEAAMQNYGKICALVPFVLWALYEIIKIPLKKLAKKGTMHADYAVLILVITTVALVVIPTVSADYALYNKYEAIRKEASTKEEPTKIDYIDPLTNEIKSTEAVLYNGIWLPEYEKMMGWAIDNTHKGSSWYHGFIGDCNNYISSNGLAGYHTARKGNSVAKTVYYDANLDGKVPEEGEMFVIGEVRGLFEDLEFKEQAKRTYTILAIQLEKQLEILTNRQKELIADVAKYQAIVTAAQNNDVDQIKSLLPDYQDSETVPFAEILTKYNSNLETSKNALDSFNIANQAKMQELAGQRVHIYDSDIKAVINILANVDTILPDGLDIVALGLTLPVGKLVGFIGDILKLAGGININDGTAVDAIIGAVCKEQDARGKYIEIATGIPAANRYDLCAPAARKIAEENGNYESIRAMQYKMDIYPQLLAFARLRRLLYISIGWLILSILIVDHYTRKIKQIENIQFNEMVLSTIENKGYVLKDTENSSASVQPVTETTTVVKEVLDFSKPVESENKDIKQDAPKPVEPEKPITENKVDEVSQEEKKPESSFQDSIINGVKNHSQGGNK